MTKLKQKIRYGNVKYPEVTIVSEPVDLTNQTMEEHKNKVLEQMNNFSLDVLLIYADRENGTNFGYLTGFEPRFEESILVLHKDGTAYLLLANESLRMEKYSRIEATAIHIPHLSLPNQPMFDNKTIVQIFKEAQIRKGMKVGIAGWKMFTSNVEDNEKIYEVPFLIVEAVAKILGGYSGIKNATDLFIHPEYGVRTQMNANEIAHYEFGASLASSCIWDLLQELDEGKTEMELASNLSAFGQPLTVQSICATGHRFTDAIIAPRNKQVKLGDKFTTTMGLRGGLTSRAAYVARDENDLSNEVSDYMDIVVKPYFYGLSTWYSNIEIGMSGGELYNLIDSVIPKKDYGWVLNPGHFTAGEEWVSSPIYPESKTVFKSGMMLQADMIVSIPGYHGSNAEDGIVLADEDMRTKLKQEYPSAWKRFKNRQEYMRQVLGIPIKDEVLPMSYLCGYLRPFLLDKKKAMYIEK